MCVTQQHCQSAQSARHPEPYAWPTVSTLSWRSFLCRSMAIATFGVEWSSSGGLLQKRSGKCTSWLSAEKDKFCSSQPAFASPPCQGSDKGALMQKYVQSAEPKDAEMFISDGPAHVVAAMRQVGGVDVLVALFLWDSWAVSSGSRRGPGKIRGNDHVDSFN